ncbi:MAG TPA: PIN domain-containing protein [Anaerolineae bacterium]|nr:PIN domain-containing protein [Anaerolineae bacterium]HMR68096.1 PIN domain-containing protein [Anaerolineae bacterium]
MIDRVFVDTNILVYAYDRSEPKKQIQAASVLNRLFAAKVGVLSPQVLAEFFVAVTRKLVAPLSIDEGYRRLVNYTQTWPIVDMTSFIVLEAVRGVRDHQLNFWDAQIWAAAKLNQIPTVLSEDFSPDSVIEGVRFVNPLAENVKIEDWL